MRLFFNISMNFVMRTKIIAEGSSILQLIALLQKIS